MTKNPNMSESHLSVIKDQFKILEEILGREVNKPSTPEREKLIEDIMSQQRKLVAVSRELRGAPPNQQTWFNPAWVAIFALALLLLVGAIAVALSTSGDSSPKDVVAPIASPTLTENVNGEPGDWTQTLLVDLQKDNVVAVNSGSVVENPDPGNYSEVVEVYLDYACSFCKMWEDEFANSSKSADSNTLFVFHLLGFLDTEESQFSTYVAAVSSNIAVNEPQKWLELHQAFFNIGDVAGEEDIIAFLGENGITNEDILLDPADLETQVYVQAVNSHSGEVIQRGVTGTPTVIVNGVKLENGFEFFS